MTSNNDQNTKVSKFKSNIGSRYTKGLFYETTKEDKSTVIYTLKENDHKGYPSLKRLYLEEEDLSEYTFASKYLDSYDHWKLLLECSWFKPLVDSWREELKLKIESRLLKDIKEIAKEETKEGFIAKRILLDHFKKNYKLNSKNTVGRPIKSKDSKEPLEPLHYTKLLKKLKEGGSEDNRMPLNEPETALTDDLEDEGYTDSPQEEITALRPSNEF